MAFELAPEARTEGYGLIVHETIGSTSTDAMDRLRLGEPGPFWVVARHQSQGRGRRGSPWQTRPGNLFASLALTTEAEPATVATLGFVAGLAVVRALDYASSRIAVDTRHGSFFPMGRGQGEGGPSSPDGAPLPHRSVLPASERDSVSPIQFQLKWPNDVLADGAKLVGILVETEMLEMRRRAVVIGIGANVAHAPEGLAYRAASLADLGLQVGAEDLFQALSEQWIEVFATWDFGRGFGEIRREWLARAIGISGPVSVKSAGGVITGSFETIDEHGQLVIEMQDETRRAISAGDVHFGEAATARTEAVA